MNGDTNTDSGGSDQSVSPGSTPSQFGSSLPPGPGFMDRRSPGFMAWSVNNPWSFPKGQWGSSPGQQPYLPTAATQPRPPSAWGTPDSILANGRNYPGQPPWPMPQPNELPGIFHGLTNELGRHGPPGVAMPMIEAGTA